MLYDNTRFDVEHTMFVHCDREVMFGKNAPRAIKIISL